MARKVRTQRNVQIKKGSRRTEVNLSNTYGIKGSSGGLGKPAVTMRKPGMVQSRIPKDSKD